MVRIFMRATSPCPVAYQRQKTWGRSLHFLPLQVRRHGALREAADTQCRRRTGLSPGALGQSVPTRVQCGFPGTAWTTTARTAPSEREALWWSQA